MPTADPKSGKRCPRHLTASQTVMLLTCELGGGRHKSSGPSCAPANALLQPRQISSSATRKLRTYQHCFLSLGLSDGTRQRARPCGQAKTETVHVGAIPSNDRQELAPGAVIGAISPTTPAGHYGRRFGLQMTSVVVPIGIPRLITSPLGPFSSAAS